MRIIVESHLGRGPSASLAITNFSGPASFAPPVAQQIVGGLATEVRGLASFGIARAELSFGGIDLPFGLIGVNDDDVLVISVDGPKRLRLKVHHVKSTQKPCSARCWDGTEGQPCVDCEKDGINYRICC